MQSLFTSVIHHEYLKKNKREMISGFSIWSELSIKLYKIDMARFSGILSTKRIIHISDQNSIHCVFQEQIFGHWSTLWEYPRYHGTTTIIDEHYYLNLVLHKASPRMYKIDQHHISKIRMIKFFWSSINGNTFFPFYHLDSSGKWRGILFIRPNEFIEPLHTYLHSINNNLDPHTFIFK